MVVHAYYPLDPRVQREAEALVDAGYEVDVVCLRDRGEAPTAAHHGVRIHRLPVRVDKVSLARQLLSYLRFLALAAARVTRLHHRRRYRVIQVHNLPDFLVLSAAVPKLRGAKVLLDLHDLMPEFFQGRFGSDARPVLAAAIRAQERLSTRFADHVVTVSSHWRQALIERGVPADRCGVVMNVADEEVFSPRPLGGDPEEFRLLYHGSVTHRYGLDLALEAVHRLRGELPHLRMTIFGRGDGIPEVREIRRRLGLEDVVEVLEDPVPRQELPDVIARGDVAIVPYRNDVFTDGIVPTKLMEYAAMRMPCIAARTTAIGSYFGGANVELFEPEDVDDLVRCIRLLATDDARRDALAARSDRFTSRFHFRRVMDDYVELVTALGTGGRPIPPEGDARPSEPADAARSAPVSSASEAARYQEIPS